MQCIVVQFSVAQYSVVVVVCSVKSVFQGISDDSVLYRTPLSHLPRGIV